MCSLLQAPHEGFLLKFLFMGLMLSSYCLIQIVGAVLSLRLSFPFFCPQSVGVLLIVLFVLLLLFHRILSLPIKFLEIF